MEIQSKSEKPSFHALPNLQNKTKELSWLILWIFKKKFSCKNRAENQNLETKSCTGCLAKDNLNPLNNLFF